MTEGLALTAIILSTINLLFLIPLGIAFVAKHYFSEYIIQKVPVELGMDSPVVGHGRPTLVDPDPVVTDAFREIGTPLTEEEEEYFKKMEKRG